MLTASLIIPEDNSRLCYQLSRSLTSEFLFLGGSITYGFETEDVHIIPFPTLIGEKLATIESGIRTFHIHNYGYCCFHSHLGIALLQQVLSNLTPDIIFLEYAVNNAYDLDYAASFEGMVQKILKANSLASIVIICTCDEHGYTCENYMVDIAAHYHLPAICISKALKAGEAFGFQWNDYSMDNCHPNQTGQQLIADCILELFSRSRQKMHVLPLPQFYLPTKPCYSNHYASAVFHPAYEELHGCGFTDSTGMEPFTHTISHIPGDTRPLEVTYSCRRLFLFYEQTSDAKTGGQIEITIDSITPPLVLDGYCIYSWDTSAIALLMDAPFGEHHIRIKMTNTDQAKTFKIYGFLTL